MFRHGEHSRRIFQRTTRIRMIGTKATLNENILSMKWLYFLTGLNFPVNGWGRKLSIVYTILYYTIFIVAVVILTKGLNPMFSLLYYMTVLEMFTILLVLWIQEKKFLSLIQSINTSEEQLFILNINSDYKWLYRKLRLQYIITVVTVGLFIAAAIQMDIPIPRKNYLYSIIRLVIGIAIVIPVAISSLFYSHYITIINLYDKRFNQLDRLLKNQLINPNVPQHVNVFRQLYLQLNNSGIFLIENQINDNDELIQKIRLCYMRLVKLAQNSDSYYGLSIVVTLITILLICSSVLYIFCSSLLEWYIIYDQLSILICWFIFSIYKAAAIVFACKNTAKSAKKIEVIVCKLRESSATPKFCSELKTFLGQLVHSELIFKPYGIIELNASTLGAIATAVVSFIMATISFTIHNLPFGMKLIFGFWHDKYVQICYDRY